MTSCMIYIILGYLFRYTVEFDDTPKQPETNNYLDNNSKAIQ